MTRSEAVRRGARLGLAVALTASIACFPASVALTLATRSRWTTAMAGLLAPAGPILAVLTLAFLVALVATKSSYPRVGRIAYRVVAVFGTLAHVVVGIGAVRFQQERGVQMTLVDLRQGLDLTFIKSQLPVLLSPVHGPALLLVLGSVALLIRRATRFDADDTASWHEPAAAFATIAAFACAVVAVRATTRGTFSVGPFRRLTLSGSHPADAIRSMHLDSVKVDAGLALLGLGRATDGCPPGVTPLESPPRDEDGARLVRALGAVSTRTLDGTGGPFSVWLIVLESMGAEDVSALEPAVPRGLTPFFDASYESGRAAGSERFASARVYQAGVRTAQAFSAVVCGYGSAPYHLAPLRDLAPLPLRCMPDLLADAGVQQRFYYAADARYDRMSHALAEHGLSDVVVPSEEDHPAAHWGVTDRALLGVARDDVPTRPLAPSFTLLFTLSTHSPFISPPDYPAETAARVTPSLQALGLAKEQSDHLKMAAYIDAVLAERLPEIRARELARGARPVFIVLGDHASGVGIGKGALHAARLPFLLWLPPPRGDETREREELRDALAATSLSQNDIPRFVVALLSASPELRNLSPSKRRHSMGGQRLSPWFGVPSPLAAGRIWTIDAVSHAHFLDASDNPISTFPAEIETRTEAVEADLAAHAPAAHALAWLEGRGKRCRASD